jgi:hypothetical protein
LRAAFQEQLESRPEALRTLRWHEHSQIGGHLTGEPQAGELAWAVGTLARWKRGELLTAMGVNDNAEWCSLNRGIARLWAAGDSVFRARAATAKHAADSAPCGTAP